MNYRLLSKVLGLLLLLLGAAMLVCLAYAFFNQERRPGLDAVESLAISLSATCASSALLLRFGRGSGRTVMRREGIAIVGLGWLICALFGALPYVFCQPSLNLAEAYFESMSGFTTTGASVIIDLNTFPSAILLWRALTQWLGGMGILVLFVALLTYLGVGSKVLFQHESSAKSGEGLQTRIRDVAKRLWQIYVILSAVCVLGLIVLGMSVFDAVTHAFTTISTGGFSTRNNSILYYQSIGIELWLTLFMALGGINFLLYAWLLRGRWQRWAKNEEIKLYFCILLAATAIIAINLFVTGHTSSPWQALRAALFTVTSIMTTTGFATDDFAAWPHFSQTLLLLLMFVGGCVGSTSGSIKVSRWLLFFKIIRVGVIGAFRPSQVIGVHLNGNPADDPLKIQTLHFVALTGVVVAVSTALVNLFEPGVDIVTSLSAVTACLFNVGPGLEMVGPTKNYGGLGPATQLFLSLLMVLGRLEIFAILVLFFPSLWRKY